MDISAITALVQKAVGTDSGLGKTVKFDFKDGNNVFIDGGSVTNDAKPADLELKMSLEDATKMFQGQLDAMSAFTQGKLQVNNPMLAMSMQGKLAALFARLKG